MELLVIVILLTVTGAQDSQLEGPQNTLGVVGSNVTLKCVSPYRNCSQLDWTKYSPGSSISIFNDGRGGIFTDNRERYSIDNSSGCDLVIKNVELTDAGRFICSAIISSSTTETAASLIILQALPKCQINASVDNTVEGDGVQLTCEVTYNGTSRASMVWKGVEDAQATVENGKTISRSYSVVASAPELPSFTCETSFPIETKDNGVPITGLATNNIPVPTCATPAIKVLYDKGTTTVTTLLLLPIAVFVGVGFLLLIILLVICFCVRSCPGYKCCHSEKKSKAKISRGEQPLRENPDIYVNVNQVGEQESAYASLGAQRDANEYVSLELRQNA